MLVTLKYILNLAETDGIAIGSFNTPDLNSLRAAIDAAEELNSPVIIQHAQVHESITPLKIIGPIMVNAARQANVPVCVHLDHGETTEYIERALDLGFTSVMFDGSTLPYEENVAGTKKTVDLALRLGASVEAELGSMGRREMGSGEKTGSDDETKIYTDPLQASKFVRETGIDALACSFGTTHGIYLKKPKLDFNVIKNVRKECDNIPIVMHGGSGISPDDFREAIKAGVRKINYFTYMDKAGGSAVKQYVLSRENDSPVFFTEAESAAREAMLQNLKDTINVFSGRRERHC